MIKLNYTKFYIISTKEGLTMKYEVIIFDADETLFDFKKSEKCAFENAMLEFNIEYNESYHLKIYEEINNALWKDFENGLITQEKLKIERFRKLSDKLNINFDPVEFAKCYMKHLSKASFLYKDSTSLIEDLYKEYTLIIITNGLRDVQNNRIRRSTIGKYFEEIIISEEVGVSKPNAEIFEIALRNTTFTDKSKILMVGDSLTSDIKGGLNFGVDTCWFNRKKTLNKTEINPTYEISNLLDLKNIL